MDVTYRDEPRYQLNDLVWVDRGSGLWLRGEVISYRGGGLYRVGIEGHGVRSVGERDLSPRRGDESG